MGNQHRLASADVTCDLCCVLVKSLLAAFWTNWSQDNEEQFRVVNSAINTGGDENMDDFFLILTGYYSFNYGKVS